jgi:hypothetical protein
MDIDDRIQREIRKRAFDRKDSLEQQTASAQCTQNTIAALEQVTGLSRLELESIAGEVSTSFAADYDDFFSIKDQLIISGLTFIPALIIMIWLMMGWVR